MVSPHEQCERSEEARFSDRGNAATFFSLNCASAAAATANASEQQVEMKDLAASKAAAVCSSESVNLRMQESPSTDESNAMFTQSQSALEESVSKTDLIDNIAPHLRFKEKGKNINQSEGHVKKYLSKTNAEAIDDVHKFLRMSGFSVPSSLDRLLGSDSRKSALTASSIASTSSVFSSFPTNGHQDLMWSVGCHTISSLKSPIFSMADIAVVVPTNVAAYEEGKESVMNNEEIRLDTDLSISSDIFEPITHSAVSCGHETNKSSITSTGVGKEEKPNDSELDLKLQSPSAYGNDALMSVNGSPTDSSLCSFDQGDDNLSSISRDSHSSLPETSNSQCVDDIVTTAYQGQAVADEILTDLPSTTEDGRCRYDTVANGADNETSDNTKALTCADVGKNGTGDLFFEDFFDVDASQESEWHQVETAKYKQKRKQNRNHSTNPKQCDKPQSTVPKQQDKPATPTARPSTLPTRSSFERKNNYKPHYEQQQQQQQQRFIPNRFLRLKAKQQSGNRRNLINTAACANSSNRSSSRLLKCSSATEEKEKKSISSSDISHKNGLAATVCNSQSEEASLTSQAVTQGVVEDSNPSQMAWVNPDSTAASSLTIAVHSPNQAQTVQVDENVNGMENPVAPSQLRQEMSSLAISPDPARIPEMSLKIEGEELMRLLKRQLEYYFSNDNLSHDSYLLSQMNDYQWVPIWTIANFKAVKKLTDDLQLVVQALKESLVVEVDEKEEKVRPNQACSLILREIPNDVKSEEITELFTDCPVKPKSCTFAGSTSWYVAFHNANDTQAAYRHLREKVCEFKGKPIMARIKNKAVHVNTYSANSVPTNNYQPVSDSSTATSSAPMPQQVASPPVDYFPPPMLVYAPQHFAPTSPHLAAGHVPAQVPSMFPRGVPPAGNAVVSTAQTPGSAVPQFVSCMMTPPPWQAPNMYPASDAQVMRPQFAAPFLQPTFKPGMIPQFHHPQQHPVPTTSSRSTAQANRYPEYQDNSSQKNSFAQQKVSSAAFVQQPHVPPNRSSVPPPAPTQPYYFVTDPSQGNLSSDVIQYLPADQSAYVSPSPNVHYLPAVNAGQFATRAPFVTPVGNDQGGIVFAPAQHQHLSMLSQAAPAYRPVVNKRPDSANSQLRSSVGYSQGENNQVVNASTSQRAHYSSSSRSSTGSYTEVSPRFHKGHHSYSANNYNGPPYPQRPASRDMSNGGSKTGGTYSSKPGSYGMADQRRGSPFVSAAETYQPDASRMAAPMNDYYGGDPGSEHYNQMKRHSNVRRGGAAAPNNAPYNGHRSAYPSGGMDRRNPRNRRARRPDEEANPHASTSAYVMGNAPFNLESNSFPPLPGAPEQGMVPVDHPVETRPVAADVVKGIDSAKILHNDVASFPDSLKKPVEKVNSSHEARNHSLPSKAPQQHRAVESAKSPKTVDVKVLSAVNTQLVADKNPPVASRHPKQANGERARDNSPKVSTQSSAARDRAPSPTKKQGSLSTAKESKPVPPAAAEKMNGFANNNNPEAKNKENEIISQEKGATKDEAEAAESDCAAADAADAKLNQSEMRPTYAQMLKTQKAMASQMNGKASSESERSESGDDYRSGDETKDSDSKAAAEANGQPKTSPPSDDEAAPNRYDRRDPSMNGSSNRRGDFEHRRGAPWQMRYQHHHHHHDGRRNFRRDWDNNGPREFRGRGFRGRRVFRDNHFHNNYSGSRPMPNGQATADR